MLLKWAPGFFSGQRKSIEVPLKQHLATLGRLLKKKANAKAACALVANLLLK